MGTTETQHTQDDPALMFCALDEHGRVIGSAATPLLSASYRAIAIRNDALAAIAKATA